MYVLFTVVIIDKSHSRVLQYILALINMVHGPVQHASLAFLEQSWLVCFQEVTCVPDTPQPSVSPSGVITRVSPAGLSATGSPASLESWMARVGLASTVKTPARCALRTLWARAAEAATFRLEVGCNVFDSVRVVNM